MAEDLRPVPVDILCRMDVSWSRSMGPAHSRQTAVLRHQAVKLGLTVRGEGYVPLSEVLNHVRCGRTKLDGGQSATGHGCSLRQAFQRGPPGRASAGAAEAFKKPDNPENPDPQTTSYFDL